MFFILAFCACRQKEIKTEKTFHCPVIVSDAIPASVRNAAFESDEIVDVYPKFMGKYKFCDRLYLDSAIGIFSNDEKIREYDFIGIFDSIDVNGFELFTDYETTVYLPSRWIEDSVAYPYYPVYFVNSTATDKMVLGKDSHLFGIQEAVNRFNYNQWQPIEYRGFDFCGNGTWGMVVHPGEFVLILMQKYAGEVKTAMRTRFRIGETTYVSKPFLGFVNPEQFSIKDSSYLQIRLQETNGNAANWLLYGAIPDEEEWAVKTF